MISYNDSILLTKSPQDQVWQASALEGLTVALVIQAWCPTPLRFNVSSIMSVSYENI